MASPTLPVTTSPAHPDDDPAGPFISLTRGAFAELADNTDIDLDEGTLERLRGLGDPTSHEDVVEVYTPLTQLLHLYRRHLGHLYRASNAFLELDVQRTPFVIGVAGSVAVGKSTTARLLKELLSRSPGNPRVELVTTDGFLYPNKTLQERGLLERKGFPESYNRRALLNFVVDVKSGTRLVEAPVYSHMTYDIVDGEQITVDAPDILIVEGLNVLQPGRPHGDGTVGLAVSDFFDFSVYVDASDDDIRGWYVDRFLQLRETAFRDPRSYFVRFSQLSDDEAVSMAQQVWDEINGPNLHQNIRPTRSRASVILRKGRDHTVETVRIRKI